MRSLPTLLLLLLLFLIVAAVIAVLAKKFRSKAQERRWPFYAKRLISQPELILYHRLVESLPDNIVLSQVQVSRVLGVKKGFSVNEWNNRINRLSYDFVICAKDATVIAVIELDDRSHEAPTRIETDKKKDKATADAGIRLIRWHVKSIPDQATIRTTIAGPKRELTTPAGSR